MLIFLIGLPGSGKTTLGKELAKLLQYKFIDTDDEIVKREGMSINDIFNQKGESYFRNLESTVLKDLITINESNVIFSTGGGTPCFFDNMEVMKASGKIVYLEVPAEAIADRIMGVKNQVRPMIKNKSKEEVVDFLKAKIAERSEYYRKADLILSSDSITSIEILNKLR